MSKTLTYEVAKLLGLPFRWGPSGWLYQYRRDEAGSTLWCYHHEHCPTWRKVTNHVDAHRFAEISRLAGPATVVELEDDRQT